MQGLKRWEIKFGHSFRDLQIEPIFWHTIELCVSFPMLPVGGQSTSGNRSYVCFTEEWSVCLARGSCRGDAWLSIDETALPSIDSDARTWPKHISRPIEAHKPHKVTKIPMDDHKPYFCISKPLLMATRFLLSCLLDPILANTLMGHDQLNGLQRVKAHSENVSSRQRLRRSGDRGTVAKITGADR